MNSAPPRPLAGRRQATASGRGCAMSSSVAQQGGVERGFGLRRIGQIAVIAQDIARATRFYRDVLGMRLLFEAPPGLAFFDCGGVRLMLSPPEGSGSAAMSSIIYYDVPDI